MKAAAIFLTMLWLAVPCAAAEPVAPSKTSSATATEKQPVLDAETAVRRGLERMRKAGASWQANETCFACHHHTLPLLACRESRRAGFPLDQAWAKSLADHAHAYFAGRADDMDEGVHVPGGAASVGYGLWALSLDDRPADDVTTAMVTYLLKVQGSARLKDREPADLTKLNDGRWLASCRRAPMQASLVGDTVLVLIGLERYAAPDQQPQLAKARAAAERWLKSVPLETQQDRLWRLWGLHVLGGDAETLRAVRAEILAAQRDDGGWAETEERASDAYSTGQTLYMLCRSGTGESSSASDPALQRAAAYLLRTQHADGSWLFVSHVKPVQPYFDNGDPHGKNQFISTAATAWATAGLAQMPPSQAAAP